MAFGWSGSNGGIAEKTRKISFEEVMDMAIGFSGSNGGIKEKGDDFMALGLSGSNGGIYGGNKRYRNPLEVSYFINNTCNLACRHCYVGYEEEQGALSIDEWKKVFDQLIELGAKTFGNVGKEPLLNWDKTFELLKYLRDRRENIRYGLVTNGILLDEQKIKALEGIRPDYIDISLDGDRDTHDLIRGPGNYEKLIKNLEILSKSEHIAGKTFISFTANKQNISVFREVVKVVYDLGVRNVLISPYIHPQSHSPHSDLIISNAELACWAQKIVAGSVINFNQYKNLRIYFKTDFTTSKGLSEELIDMGIIDLNNLFEDYYKTIFCYKEFGNNRVIFNHIPRDNTFVQAIRISHDGYVSDCESMFHSDYPQRAIGNVRKKSIAEILEPYRCSLAVV